VAEINPTVRLVLGLFNPPTGAACAATGTATKASSAHAARASSARAKQASALGGVGDLTGRLGKKAKGH
jgi:hypothetical protein